VKGPDQWGENEWLVAAFVGLLCYGGYESAAAWCARRGPTWLLENEVLVPQDRSLVHLASLGGGLDAPRIVAVVAFVVVLFVGSRLLARPILEKRRTAAAAKGGQSGTSA